MASDGGKPRCAHRVVVWATGGVGANAIRAIVDRPDLELVGVWVHTPEKIGRDAGELAGIAPLGIAATGDADELIALDPDCVVYAASGPERGAGAVTDYERLLAAGINIVTTTSTELVYPPAADEALRERLHKAAAAGDASLYTSGIFPGFASDELALLLTTQSRNIRTLRVVECSLNDHYPVADVMMDGLGFARSLDFEPFIALAGSHSHGVAGTDRAHRTRARRRARRDSRSVSIAGSPTATSKSRSGRCPPEPWVPFARSRAGSSTARRRSSSTMSSAWRGMSRGVADVGERRDLRRRASRVIPTSRVA